MNILASIVTFVVLWGQPQSAPQLIYVEHPATAIVYEASPMRCLRDSPTLTVCEVPVDTQVAFRIMASEPVTVSVSSFAPGRPARETYVLRPSRVFMPQASR